MNTCFECEFAADDFIAASFHMYPSGGSRLFHTTRQQQSRISCYRIARNNNDTCKTILVKPLFSGSSPIPLDMSVSNIAESIASITSSSPCQIIPTLLPTSGTNNSSSTKPFLPVYLNLENNDIQLTSLSAPSCLANIGNNYLWQGKTLISRCPGRTWDANDILCHLVLLSTWCSVPYFIEFSDFFTKVFKSQCEQTEFIEMTAVLKRRQGVYHWNTNFQEMRIHISQNICIIDEAVSWTVTKTGEPALSYVSFLPSYLTLCRSPPPPPPPYERISPQ